MNHHLDHDNFYILMNLVLGMHLSDNFLLILHQSFRGILTQNGQKSIHLQKKMNLRGILHH
jgi:hypothetical protein